MNIKSEIDLNKNQNSNILVILSEVLKFKENNKSVSNSKLYQF